MEKLLPKNYDPSMPRTDYPRPSWVRDNWYCLNGTWKFAYDHGRSGEARGMMTQGEYPLEINVPFCPESRLSGIGNTDFIPAVWYKKTVFLDPCPEGRVILHFGAVDYLTKVWVNGILCGRHKGGYSAFSLDITAAIRTGENVIVVYAEDDLRSGLQPSGKQSKEYGSICSTYTRTTGIWQTVWLEIVPQRYLVTAKMTPHATEGCLEVRATAYAPSYGDRLKLCAYYKGKKVGQAEAQFVGELATARITVDEVHLWEVGAPEIYDLTLELVDGSNGETVDYVQSYFAMRDVSFTKKSLEINGKPVFMRLILDQGYNPEGIYTAPSAEYLKKDIELAIELGFNGARLHQRIFEERTLYYADILGYMVWVEMPISPRSSLETLDPMENYIPEWIEIVNSHYNHPSVVGWCTLNETFHRMKMNAYSHELFYSITKEMDAYRPTIDASGGVHYKTDMFDTHDYEQNVEVFKNHYENMLNDDAAFFPTPSFYRGDAPLRHDTYAGQAFWVSEYGGTFWNNKDRNGWGYGSIPQNENEFAERYVGLTDVLLSHPRICGFCYTQLTDIEQEQNGLFYYDRTKKFSDDVYIRIREINTKQAEIEKYIV